MTAKHFPKKATVSPCTVRQSLCSLIPIDNGTFEDGKKFDSSRDRGKPFECQIGVGQVIRGWDEGVPQMSLGEKAVLKISYDYGYGDKGYPGNEKEKSSYFRC